jgi:hypothetical protein
MLLEKRCDAVEYEPGIVAETKSAILPHHIIYCFCYNTFNSYKRYSIASIAIKFDQSVLLEEVVSNYTTFCQIINHVTDH